MIPKSGAFYNSVLKRTPTYMAFIVAGAITFEWAVNTAVDKVWDAKNKGVRWYSDC
jgi:hypothetical protein